MVSQFALRAAVLGWPEMPATLWNLHDTEEAVGCVVFEEVHGRSTGTRVEVEDQFVRTPGLSHGYDQRVDEMSTSPVLVISVDGHCPVLSVEEVVEGVVMQPLVNGVSVR